MEKLRSAQELRDLRNELIAKMDPGKTCVRICMTGCRAYGAEQVRDAFREELEREGLGDEVEIRETGCHGFCARAPVIVIDPQGIFYQQLAPEDVADIISQTLQRGTVIERLLYVDPQSGERIAYERDVPFYKGQQRNVLHNCGVIDPTNISHYIARGGYSVLEKALLSMRPEEIISQVTKSGLRGARRSRVPHRPKMGFCPS